MPKKQTKKQDQAAAMPLGAFKNFFWPTIPTRRQASSNKLQATSSPAGLNDATIKRYQ